MRSRGIWRGEKAWDGLDTHTVPAGCISSKSGTEPQRPQSLCYCTAEKMCQTYWLNVSSMCCNSQLLLSIIFGTELDCRRKGLNAAAGACFSIDTSPDVRRCFLKTTFKYGGTL